MRFTGDKAIEFWKGPGEDLAPWFSQSPRTWGTEQTPQGLPYLVTSLLPSAPPNQRSVKNTPPFVLLSGELYEKHVFGAVAAIL